MGDILILPTLYKKTSNGKIEQWSIRAVPAITDDEAFLVITEYGHKGGKLQEACERVEEGKNLGKANETSPKEQAHSQARSEWNTKLTRKGYAERLDDAEAGKNAGAGGIRPMLAQSFSKHGDKLRFPLYSQPKLDGMRCIAMVSGSGVTLWTREQKPITAVPHIVAAVEELGLPAGTVLDGELYNHDLKNDFEKIISAARKQGPVDDEAARLIQYHVYDIPRHPNLKPSAHFGERTIQLKLCLPNGAGRDSYIRWVNTRMLSSAEELTAFFDHCREAGYEGCMARGLEPYEEGKRSYGLQKLKEFDEAEYLVVDVEEGVGKMEGLAIFVCTTLPPSLMAVDPDRYEKTLFRCKMEGELEGLRKYVTNKKLAVGKLLTVKYQGITGKNKLPRFPVGKAIRDYE